MYSNTYIYVPYLPHELLKIYHNIFMQLLCLFALNVLTAEIPVYGKFKIIWNIIKPFILYKFRVYAQINTNWLFITE